MAQASFEPGRFQSRVLRSAFAQHWLGMCRFKFWGVLKMIDRSNGLPGLSAGQVGRRSVGRSCDLSVVQRAGGLAEGQFRWAGRWTVQVGWQMDSSLGPRQNMPLLPIVAYMHTLIFGDQSFQSEVTSW